MDNIQKPGRLEKTESSNSILKKECTNALLEYANGIITVRVKEGAEISLTTMKEQYAVQESMVGNDDYVVLVDGSKNSIASPETRQFMADHQPPNRKATAILSDRNLATQLMANFYLRFHQPKIHTRLFKLESEAIEWLKQMLDKK